MEENSRVKRRKCSTEFWVVIGWKTLKALKNKGIPRFSFRFESTSAHQKHDFDAFLCKKVVFLIV